MLGVDGGNSKTELVARAGVNAPAEHGEFFLAARAEDGRGERTVLVELVRSHVGLSVAEVGDAVHYKRLPSERLAKARLREELRAG